ncbi:hypothetical protein ABKA04_007081 [Annulohypoxylon sp. FPYF3050]
MDTSNFITRTELIYTLIKEKIQGIKLLVMQSETVADIVGDLSKRDPRFQFIKNSLNEFLLGEFGLIYEAHRLTDKSFSDPLEAEKLCDDPAQREHRGPLDEKKFWEDLIVIFDHIVIAAIYELLNVFDIDITLSQAQELDHSSRGLLKLLVDLNVRSKDLAPRPSRSVLHEDSLRRTLKNDDCIYQKRLKTPNIRVLCIEPGPKDSPLECRLKERDLYKDKIGEALSYVWGEPKFDQEIKIDGSPFKVTTNLRSILCSLRHEDAIREIWIDAICINQSDLQEKSHQVRLMRDIYLKASKTRIWLGDWPPQAMIPEKYIMEIPKSVFAPVPQGFGGNLVDQYDIAGMLEEYQKFREANPWVPQLLALKIMIIRCVNIIMAHPWWERVWTIQEAALPPEEPIIHFRNYSFPYSTLISALDTVNELDIMPESHEVPITMGLIFTYQILHWTTGRKNSPFIRMIRPEKRLEQHLYLQDRRLQSMLTSVATYHATDPRDKVFALQSLLIRSLGRLINVDYSEPTWAVFGRVTAWFFNQRLTDGITRYKFRVESHGGLGDHVSGPSWVFDFSYSTFTREGPSLTMQAFLRQDENLPPEYELPYGQDICFATPTTLFCTGIWTSAIRYIKLVPDFAEAGFLALLQSVMSFVEGVFEEWSKLIESDNSLDGRQMCPRSLPEIRDVIRLLTLNSIVWRDIIESNVLRYSEHQMYQALHECTGTYLFITEDSIVGLATAPIQNGDILSIVHQYPYYVILRETEQQDVTKHRIVARAAITESKEKMKARIENSPQTSAFQII